MATRKRRKKVEAGSTGLSATEVAEGEVPAELEALEGQVEADGGTVLARYREPFGGHWVLFASLPLDRVEPTPYQRELSAPHVERLAQGIPKVGRFLDPVIAIRHDGGYWTPNGMHRLEAMRTLGARAVLALLLPEPEVAFRILALNTEKAHNLHDKSLETVRMMRALAATPETAKRPESDWAFEFEEPALLTLGLCYEQRPRFSGSAYLPILRRLEEFSDDALALSLSNRQDRAAKLLELDDEVAACVQQLREAGFQSAYLKPFVVARLNPLRFRQRKVGEKAPPADFDETLDRMLDAARRFDPGRVRPDQIAALGGGATTEA